MGKKKKGWNDGEKPDEKDAQSTVYAAGAVLHRRGPGGVEVAMVHRPRYDDWSLPKGKVDEGESLPVTAVREIEEETGFPAVLGRYLGMTTYELRNGARKQVWYWAATPGEGTFRSNDECDALEWVSVDEAKQRVSYELDEGILDAFAEFVVPDFDVARRVLLVRHARAGDRSEWSGNDALRPLDKKGRKQAEFLTPLLRAFGAAAIVSAEPDRCVQTVQPLAEELGVEVAVDATVGDIAAERDPRAAAAVVRGLADERITVVSSQGSAIPSLLEVLTAGTPLADRDFSTKKAGVWVLSFVGDELRAADYLASPLPVKQAGK